MNHTYFSKQEVLKCHYDIAHFCMSTPQPFFLAKVFCSIIIRMQSKTKNCHFNMTSGISHGYIII